MTAMQRHFLIWAIATASLMPLIAFGLKGQTSSLGGYMLVLCIYWFGFCLPQVIWNWKRTASVPIRLSWSGHWLWPVLAIAVPVVLAIGAHLMRPLPPDPKMSLMALGVLAALINGPLEELAWRKPFRAASKGSFRYEALGLCFFTAWHFAIVLSYTPSNPTDGPILIVTAAVLGGLWLYLTRQSNAVGWPMLSHATLNLLIFPAHFVLNFG